MFKILQLGFFQFESAVLWCYQNVHITYEEHSYDLFLHFFNYINTLVIISSY